MASSEAVTTNTDLPRDSNPYTPSSLSTLLSDPIPIPISIPMDDIIKSISIFPSHLPPLPPPPNSADDLWASFFPSRDAAPHSFGGMSLEQFLHKNAPPPITAEEDITGVSPPPSATSQFSVSAEGSSSVEAFGSGVDRAVGGKGKRKAVVEPTDKATLQKQRRMIKNRESAARSRERKQAYTSELEYLVQQLEQENARLLKEEDESKNLRLKQLRECLIPIVEKKPSPKRGLFRTNSVQSM